MKGFRAVDAIAAAVLVALSFLGTEFSSLWDLDLWLTITLGIAPLTRKRWPIPTFLALFAILSVSALRVEITVACILVAGLAAYIVRRDFVEPTRAVATAVLFLGDIIGLAIFTPGLTDTDPLKRAFYVFWSVTLLAACAMMGELRRRTLEAQKELLQRSLEAQRQHIAREIHDLVTHSLTVITAQADGGRYANTEAAKDEALVSIAQVGRESLRQMRSVVSYLREGEGHAVSPSIGANDIPELIQQIKGMRVNYNQMGEVPDQLDGAVSLTIYRIVQEALTNAQRHGAGSADLELEWQPDQVKVTVQNPFEVRPTGIGHGITGMRERAELSGGSCESRPIDGLWQVRATLPLGGRA